jgi:protein TonB
VLNSALLFTALRLLTAMPVGETRIAVELQAAPKMATSLPPPPPRMQQIKRQAERIVAAAPVETPPKAPTLTQRFTALLTNTPTPVPPPPEPTHETPQPVAAPEPVKTPEPPAAPIETPTRVEPVATAPALTPTALPGNGGGKIDTRSGDGGASSAPAGGSGNGNNGNGAGSASIGSGAGPGAHAGNGDGAQGNQPGSVGTGTPGGGDPNKTPGGGAGGAQAQRGSDHTGTTRSVSVKSNPQPAYPPDARDEGIQGLVKLRVTINENGHVVGEPTIIKKSGCTSLDKSALRGVKQWIFEPALEDGKPVTATMVVDIRFELK